MPFDVYGFCELLKGHSDVAYSLLFLVFWCRPNKFDTFVVILGTQTYKTRTRGNRIRLVKISFGKYLHNRYFRMCMYETLNCEAILFTKEGYTNPRKMHANRYDQHNCFHAFGACLFYTKKVFTQSLKRVNH